jgi:23S rRNA pseudouridine1911/1915/1917 synthase
VDKLEPEPIPLDIIAEDKDVIVLNKPPGMVVHPAHGNTSGTLVHGLLFHAGAAFAEMADEEQRPGIVHRLDKDTSGGIVVAKNSTAQLLLKDAFQQRLVEKTYLAIVLGSFDVLSGRIEANIGRHPVNRQRMAVVERGGKHAVTLFRVLGQNHGCALLEVKILTGRTHQIRVHCAFINHPILGDHVYGGRPRNAPLQPPRQMLHAWKIVFPHPRSKIMRQHMAPLPDDFRDALAALELPLIGEHQPPQDPPLDPDAEPGSQLARPPVDLMDDVEEDDLLEPGDDDWPENDDLSPNYDLDDDDDP